MERFVGILESIPNEWTTHTSDDWEVDGWPLQIFRSSAPVA